MNGEISLCRGGRKWEPARAVEGGLTDVGAAVVDHRVLDGE